MTPRTMRTHFLTTALIAFAALCAVATPAPLPAQTAAPTGVLAREATAPLVPPSVFFAGQVASTQARNSAAVRLPGGALVIAALVDTGGYSSDVKERYQAYLIAEAALSIDGHDLPAGAYGCGFLAGDAFVVMDIGGHDLFTAHSTQDAGMRRPVPLQMQAGPNGGSYRLYAGRSFVTITLHRPVTLHAVR